jgi:ribonuclease D
MPAFTDQTRLIDSQEKLDEFCGELLDPTAVAVDTEFARTETYFPKLCLFQLAINTHLVCIDVVAELDTTALRRLLFDGPALKIFHAAKQDLEVIYTTYGRLPEPIIDTQIAAGLMGHQPQIGYASLVQELVGITLAKGHTRTDWCRRPLSAEQLDYAIDDVRYLAEIHAKLQAGLERSGRCGWVIEDSAALVDPGLYVAVPEDAWNRLPSIPYLPVPIQARARRLAAWREKRAKDVNRPRRWVLADKTLLAIAAANPGNESELRGLSQLPPAVIRNQGEVLLSELRRADDDVQADRVQFGQQSKPQPPNPRALKKLSEVVSKTADELGIATEILATRRDLAALLRGDQDIRPLNGWRRQVIGEKLLSAS